MDKSNRPMFVIRNAKKIHLNENETPSNTLADIDGADEVNANKNKSGVPTNKLISEGKKHVTIWRKIFNFILENIKTIFIGVTIAALSACFGFN
ncbi:hypothetical protein [Citrobacter portucalensis]|uniref:hypothetical protein n=1 Tax=Citrobacter portucalensis TaxID=1639133 RepID=UPI002433B39D|nr:hypothetical protein [Citrobacter portucalensis]WFZ31230.1 hypothetical protein NFK62_10595 [Citrobacter portucalensis]WFZ36231.1 hypothetical protein NFK63_10585 [Citrobacter portucalensis]